MWVTVLASHPSVSIDTDTTQRTCSPSRPRLPTVFITSRRRSSSVRLSTSAPGLRSRNSALNTSISRAAALRKSSFRAWPDSSWAESTMIVGARSIHSPSATLESSGSFPARSTSVPSGSSTTWPAIQSKTSFDTMVFGHTTMKTGGGSPSGSSSRRQWSNRLS